MKAQRKCGNCGKPGHRADRCPDLGAPAGEATTAKPRVGRAPMALVSVSDLPMIKESVIEVVSALEKVEPPHRERVIQSARLILGE